MLDCTLQTLNAFLKLLQLLVVLLLESFALRLTMDSVYALLLPILHYLVHVLDQLCVMQRHVLEKHVRKGRVYLYTLTSCRVKAILQ